MCMPWSALLTSGTWQQDAGDKQEAHYLQLDKTEVERLKVWMVNSWVQEQVPLNVMVDIGTSRVSFTRIYRNPTC